MKSTEMNIALFNWKSFNDASAFSPKLAELLDLLSELAADGYDYFHFALRNGCDVFDWPLLLHWAEEEYPQVIDSEFRSAVEEGMRLERSLPAFLTRTEMEQRLQVANGSCPLCGETPSFSHDADQDRARVMGHCPHLGFQITESSSLDEVLRSPRVWNGHRWPYSHCTPVAMPDGRPFPGKRLAGHCSACRKQDGIRQLRPIVRSFLDGLLATSRDPEFQGVGGHPLKSIVCTDCNVESGQGCEHEQRKIERMVEAILSTDQGEYRLNNSGLKLYTSGVSVRSFLHDCPLRFGMCIDGDQTHYYPKLVAYANLQLWETGLRDVEARLGEDMPAALASTL